jgi:hypothetical protein
MYKRNADENHNEMPPLTYKSGKIQKLGQHTVSKASGKNTHTLLMEVYNRTTPMKNLLRRQRSGGSWFKDSPGK